MTVRSHVCNVLQVTAVCLVVLSGRNIFGQAPTLESVFPAGCQAGTTVDVTVTGSNLQGLATLKCNATGAICERVDASHFRLTIPAGTQPGLYDLWGMGDQGLSLPRTFAISNRAEQLEIEPKDNGSPTATVPLNVVINGRCEKANDSDHFRFDAKRGQRVVVECWAERIDSRLRAVLEIYDSAGRRLEANRGYFGIDPLIDFRVPSDGSYIVKVQDLISSGSAEHYYRLEIDTGPRVAFTVPNVIQRGKPVRLALYGWNLPVTGQFATAADDLANLAPHAYDCLDVDLPETLAQGSGHLPVRLDPAQAVLDAIAYHFPGSHTSAMLGVTDASVVLDCGNNHSAQSAQVVSVPCEVSGQLVAGDECDWFSIQAQRGEVLYLEAFGQRIHSPVDLQLSVARRANSSTQNSKNHAIPVDVEELVQFNDEVRNIGGHFPTNHLDPAGRWVCPADGQYLITVRNLIGGLHTDSRRTYRLSVRREEPDFQLVAVPHADHLAGLNVRRGGREILDLLAFRRRGFDGAIRVSARDLPLGVDCPDVWLGPGVERTNVVVSADLNSKIVSGELHLVGTSDETEAGAAPHSALPVHDTESGTALSRPHEVRGGTVVRSGTPNGWGRISSEIPLAIVGEAPFKITANGHEPVNHHLYGKLQVRHSPGGVLDIAVQLERREFGHQAPVKLIGFGLPDTIPNQTVVIPEGQERGHLSFYLPPTLSVGRYSLLIRAETTVPTADKKTAGVVAYSNPVTFDVQPATFVVEVDPFAVTRAKRGEVIQIEYSVKRINGFIGKLHTELAVPGRITDITGLRGRGATFVGQSDKGSLQITVNDDAPLGRQPFLRIFTVGVLEDEPIYHGGAFLSLEIVE
ncbi:MAG: hypothetical protein JWM11_3621 [Planctomycetaceae bacterium]|nr:hypothetical protein [Planctomycetaceae bacterium]